MEDETRLAPPAQNQPDKMDSTCVAHSVVADGETTRIANSARYVDLETEGTRIRGIPARRPGQAAEQELNESHKIGDKIGNRYEVLAIHRGTMGVVYGTFDVEEKLPRALKTLQNRHIHDRQLQSLFIEEAATWVKLEKHPYIVRAYLVERFNGLPYVITEYVRGPQGVGADLRAWLGHARLTLPTAVEMALQIAQGMQHAVRKVPGLVHRDLKPANILVDENSRALVTDFGLVEADEAGAGTPAYMAPEQWRSESIDVQTDIYAFGCILYEMITGHRMFPAQSESDWEVAHKSYQPIDPIQIKPDLDPRISEFIGRCISKNRAQRPADWDAVVVECGRWFHDITGLPVVFDFSGEQLSTYELLLSCYSLFELGKFQDMLPICDRVLAIDVNISNAWFHKGNSLSGLKRHAEGIAAYDQALSIDQRYSKAWANRGISLYWMRNHEDAIASYDKALAIDPCLGDVWYNKGNSLSALNRDEEAVAAYCSELEINPEFAPAWFNKGSSLNRLGRYTEAIQAFDRALLINSSHSSYWHNKGNAFFGLKRYAEAIEAYDQALGIENSYSGSWHNKGVALSNLGYHAEAIIAFDQAIRIDPKHKNAWHYKGVSLSALDRHEEASISFGQAQALNR